MLCVAANIKIIYIYIIHLVVNDLFLYVYTFKKNHFNIRHIYFLLTLNTTLNSL